MRVEARVRVACTVAWKKVSPKRSLRHSCGLDWHLSKPSLVITCAQVPLRLALRPLGGSKVILTEPCRRVRVRVRVRARVRVS